MHHTQVSQHAWRNSPSLSALHNRLDRARLSLPMPGSPPKDARSSSGAVYPSRRAAWTESLATAIGRGVADLTQRRMYRVTRGTVYPGAAAM